MYLSHICTLEEAANYLSGETGDSWTPKSVLDFALTKPKQSSRKPAPIAFAAMPTETVFGRYEFTSPGGMVRKGGARWQLVPLYPIHAAQLVAAGNTFAGLLKSPDDDYSDGEHYEFIDPIESEHEITLDMVRLKRAAIESIANRHNTASSGTPESDERPADISMPTRPPPAQRHQENEILRVIRELGYDAKALPKDICGKKGVKAEVRAKLPNLSPKIFDKAWERLSSNEEIIKLK